MQNLSTSPKKLDLKQFTLFKKVGVLSLSNYLWKNRDFWEKQKNAFLKNIIKIPNIEYKGLEKRKIEERLIKLKDFLQQVKKESFVIKSAYIPKVREKTIAWEALGAVLNKDDILFSNLSKQLYGEPCGSVFNSAIFEVKEKLKKSIQIGSEEEKEAAKKSLDVFPENNNHQVFHNKLPDKFDIQEVRKYLQKEFSGIFEVTSCLKEKKYDAKEIADVFSAALVKMNIFDWKVAVRCSSRGAVSVDPADKKVYIPAQRVLRGNLLGSLLIHEIGTHLMRARNGTASPLLLLGRGLDHYETAEEGIATVREQAVRGELKDFEGLDGYLAVSLALGLDGQPRNFRELYDVMQPYLYWRFVKKGYRTALTKSKNWAWYRCLRVFLGTSGLTPGACYTKDIIYRAGNIKIWNLIKQNPESLKKFNIGKYDPTNQAHLEIIKKLVL